MERREALSKLTLLLGIALVDAEALLARRPALAASGDPYHDLLEAIADVILPDTPDSPGAKKTGVGPFMALVVADCYSPEEQALFKEGIDLVNAHSQRAFDRDFLALNPVEQKEILTNIDRAARLHEHNKTNGLTPRHHSFTVVKQVAAFAYFSSEIGTTQALRYNPIPGRFDGCVPYVAGEKAWS